MKRSGWLPVVMLGALGCVAQPGIPSDEAGAPQVEAIVQTQDGDQWTLYEAQLTRGGTVRAREACLQSTAECVLVEERFVEPQSVSGAVADELCYLGPDGDLCFGVANGEAFSMEMLDAMPRTFELTLSLNQAAEDAGFVLTASPGEEAGEDKASNSSIRDQICEMSIGDTVSECVRPVATVLGVCFGIPLAADLLGGMGFWSAVSALTVSVPCIYFTLAAAGVSKCLGGVLKYIIEGMCDPANDTAIARWTYLRLLKNMCWLYSKVLPSGEIELVPGVFLACGVIRDVSDVADEAAERVAGVESTACGALDGRCIDLGQSQPCAGGHFVYNKCLEDVDGNALDENMVCCVPND